MEGASSSASRVHVLVVDDDDLMCKLAAAFLEKLGCRASICRDRMGAEAALARAEEAGAPVNLVVVDLHLGAVSGLDVCRRLRSLGVAVPIVCMSGDVGAIARDTYEAAGFDDVIAKPVGLAQFRACIARHTRRAMAP